MKVKIISPVEYDGKRLEEGESADLPKKIALDLIAAKAAVDPAELERLEAERLAAEEAARKQVEADAEAARLAAKGTSGT